MILQPLTLSYNPKHCRAPIYRCLTTHKIVVHVFNIVAQLFNIVAQLFNIVAHLFNIVLQP